MRPEAREAVIEGMRRWANPSSPHAEGRAARASLEDARERIKAALGWTGQIILTSGASEALAIGLGRAKADRRLVSAAEHDAVFRAAPHAQVLPIADGRVDGEALAVALAQDGRAVVAIQHVNSETGTVLLSNSSDPVIAQVREAGGLFLCDCSQSAGKFELPDVDLAVVSAHKLGGPPGIGALLVRDLGCLEPSGGQEFGYRGGTENLPAALGFAAALEARGTESWATTAEERFAFRDVLSRGGEMVAPGVQCSYIFACAMERLSAAAQLIRFDAQGFAISAGSACSSGTLKRSRALGAFGIEPEIADRTVRISIGWNTTPAELDAFADAWLRISGQGGIRAA